jgi:hypothetical protein
VAMLSSRSRPSMSHWLPFCVSSTNKLPNVWRGSSQMKWLPGRTLFSENIDVHQRNYCGKLSKIQAV